MIDILIAHKNHSDYLIHQLVALNPALEVIGKIIIVDDYSDVDHYNKLQDFANLEKVIICKNDGEFGMQNAYNIALAKSTSNFVYYASCDDCVNSNFLKIGYYELNKSSANFFVAEIREIYYKDNDIINVNECDFLFKELLYIKPQLFSNLYNHKRKYFSGGATIYKRAFMCDIGGYRSDLGLYSDIAPQIIGGFTDGFIYCPMYASDVKIKSISYNVKRANNLRLRCKDGKNFILFLDQYKNINNYLEKVKIGDLTSSFFACAISNIKLIKYFKFNLKNLLIEILSLLYIDLYFFNKK